MCQETFLELLYSNKSQEALLYAQNRLANLVAIVSEEYYPSQKRHDSDGINPKEAVPSDFGEVPFERRGRAVTLGSYSARTATNSHVSNSRDKMDTSSVSGGNISSNYLAGVREEQKQEQEGKKRSSTSVFYAPLSYEEYAASLRTQCGMPGVSRAPSDSPGERMRNRLRHLTSLLVFPSSSAEILTHPVYGPNARDKRLRFEKNL